MTEMRDQALDRPRRSVAERADGVALDLFCHLQQHVDLALVGAAFGHPGQDPPHPARALAAWRALTAALVLVEIGNPRDRPDQVGRFVHHDDGGGAETGAQFSEAVEIHRAIDDLLGRHHAHRGAAGNDSLEIAPAAADAAAMPLDQFAERDPHRLFDVAGTLDMAGDTEQLGADIVGPADAGEPCRTPPQDIRRYRDRLDIVDGGRAAVETDIGRERWLQPRHALLAFEAFQERGFFAADIGAGTMGHVKVEREAVDIVLADQLGLIGLIDRGLQMLALAYELSAHIDVAGVRAHREAGDQAALDQKMRIVPHDLAVLAGAGFRFVGIDHEIARPAVLGFLWHERPFQAGRETRPAAPAQARGLHLVDDPVAALVDDRLGAVPGAAAARAFKTPVFEAIEISEDAVLVVEHDLKLPARSAVGCAVTRHVVSFSVVGPPTGAEN